MCSAGSSTGSASRCRWRKWAPKFTPTTSALDYRGAVDFDDLIRLALTALERDEDYLERLRRRWPYILEDEAQDSSRLQEETLKLLAGPAGNWVRVGDPNQAIYETFTTADPRFLMNFIQRPDVQERRLPNSGRSTLSIIDLANYLVQWTRAEHPLPDARDALQAAPLIEPTPPGDPQPNPPDAPEPHLAGRGAPHAGGRDRADRRLAGALAAAAPRKHRGGAGAA
ncbi:MAG: UvrD-helicase domain-containing protein [Anaerolineales bacterium]|nr:UvrD-helicase domain-containing protein [Anaerolineales bacterium]